MLLAFFAAEQSTTPFHCQTYNNSVVHVNVLVHGACKWKKLHIDLSRGPLTPHYMIFCLKPQSFAVYTLGFIYREDGVSTFLSSALILSFSLASAFSTICGEKCRDILEASKMI